MEHLLQRLYGVDAFARVRCRLTPHRSESFNLESVVISENFPLTAVSLFAAAGPLYTQALSQVVSRANSVYNSFMKSEEGHGFSGQVGVTAVRNLSCVVED